MISLCFITPLVHSYFQWNFTAVYTSLIDPTHKKLYRDGMFVLETLNVVIQLIALIILLDALIRISKRLKDSKNLKMS